MFILAAMMIPCSALTGLIAAVLKNADRSQLPAEAAEQFQKLEEQWRASGLTPSIVLGLSITILVIGIVLLVLGIVVRRGGLASAVTSIVICCLLSVLALLSVFSGAVAMSQGNSEGGLAACIWGVLLALLLYTLIGLFQAARNSGQISAYRVGYQAQFQQYPQQNYPPSQQPQNWQTPPQQWNQPAWPPTQQPPQPPQQNWPPPPPPPPADPT
jgi:hypothetical protein